SLGKRPGAQENCLGRGRMSRGAGDLPSPRENLPARGRFSQGAGESPRAPENRRGRGRFSQPGGDSPGAREILPGARKFSELIVGSPAPHFNAQATILSDAVVTYRSTGATGNSITRRVDKDIGLGAAARDSSGSGPRGS